MNKFGNTLGLYCCATLVWLGLFGLAGPVLAAPLKIVDDAGKQLQFTVPPARVVSLVPSATEIIFAIGGKDALVGITHHSTHIQGAARKPIVGGFFSPSAERVLDLKPDLVILGSFQKKTAAALDGKVPLLIMQTRKMDDAFRHIEMMGALFERRTEATALIRKNRTLLDLIARKAAKIPPEKRRRVMRLMGRGEIMTPGRDSFQNEIIRAAGGIAPDFQADGQVVPLSREQFVQFDPQFLYGCGEDYHTAKPLLAQTGYKDVTAVRNHRVRTFPCDLTCRSGAHVGYFVAWLSAEIYADIYRQPDMEVLPRKITAIRPVSLDLDYVTKAKVATVRLNDFENKSLIIDFNTPQTIVSTLEGQRSGVLTVGNHYSPPPCWAVNAMSGLAPLHALLYPVIGTRPAKASFLFTGASMDCLAVNRQQYKEMTVYGLVTAGVRGNALRMGTDSGDYYEPGTINMIFLTNMQLSPRAMTRAIISATEGKTAALQDLEIRSSYQPLTAAATGTGTDNIIVVQGQGTPIDNAGGHTKMGELIARAAYAGVQEAIFKQNGLVTPRDIFQRLKERRLTVPQLVNELDCECARKENGLAGQVEQVLIDPAYAGFLEAALALSDAHGRGAVSNLALFQAWCLETAGRIAGKKVEMLTDHMEGKNLPAPLAMALNAVLTGIIKK